MEKIKLTAIMIFSVIAMYGQGFAPVGAEWHYDIRFAFASDITYSQFSSEKDTFILGENCRKITKYNASDNYYRPKVEYLFSRNDTVFFLDTAFNEFQILYVFNAVPTESWSIRVKDENQNIKTITVTVDSVGTSLINDENLKTLYVTYQHLFNGNIESYNSTIIEKIGDVQQMFNWIPWSNTVQCSSYSNGLRCYQDDNVGLYSTGIAESCDYTSTGIEDMVSFSNIQLLPNPAYDMVEIKVPDNQEYNIRLLDLNGKLIQSWRAFSSKIKLNISDLKEGVYLISLHNDKQIVGRKKLIKR